MMPLLYTDLALNEQPGRPVNPPQRNSDVREHDQVGDGDRHDVALEKRNK